jgi:hypothetical protein
LETGRPNPGARSLANDLATEMNATPFAVALPSAFEIFQRHRRSIVPRRSIRDLTPKLSGRARAVALGDCSVSRWQFIHGRSAPTNVRSPLAVRPVYATESCTGILARRSPGLRWKWPVRPRPFSDGANDPGTTIRATRPGTALRAACRHSCYGTGVRYLSYLDAP